MKLIIGLGNPGKKYAKTRHNAGFMLADKLQKEWNFPTFEFDKKNDIEISAGKISVSSRVKRSEVEGSNKILLVKPQTYMNNSGVAVKKIMDFYKLNPKDIIVIHDDLDIELGKYKIAIDSSSAGHQGVQNIIDTLCTQNFKRVRIGIEGEEKRKSRKIPGDQFVLKNFTVSEIKKVQKITGEINASIQNLLL